MKYIAILLIALCILAGANATSFKKHQNTVRHQAARHMVSMLHLDDEQDEQCVSNAAQQCYGDVDPSNQAYLAQQLQDLQTWAQSIPSEDEIRSKITELMQDAKTGPFWTCVVQGAQACSGGDLIQRITISKLFHKGEQEEEQCFQGLAQQCASSLNPADYGYLQQQAKDLEAWGQSNPDQQQIQDKLDELTSDPKTGSFWQCILQGAQKCDGGDAIQQNIVNKIKAHKKMFHADDGEQCVESAAQQCFTAVNPADYGYLQQQAEGLEQWAQSEPSEEDVKAKLEELTSDDKTGEFWTCVLKAADSCSGGELIVNHQQLHLGIDKQCAKKELQQCASQVDPSTVPYLKQQFQSLNKFAQTNPNPDQVQAKIQELLQDPKTGSFWQCFFTGLQKCDDGKDELFGQSKSFNLMQVALYRSFHSKVDRACFNKEAQACVSQVDKSLIPYLQQQFQDLKKFSESQPSQADIQAKIQNLLTDPKTGSFWQCFFAGVRKCDDGQNNIVLSFKNLRGKN